MFSPSLTSCKISSASARNLLCIRRQPPGPDLAPRQQLVGADVFALLQQGLIIPATDYLDAQRVRTLLARDFAKIWESLDCLLAPVTAITAPRIGEMALKIDGADEDVRLASTRLTRPFNVLGWPALALPCGLSKNRLPIGLQIVAAPHREKILFQLGSALEDALGFASQ